jgi:hypothetical protein
MENAKENNWTEETVREHMFKMVEMSDNGIDWTRQKLMGFFPDNSQPFSNCGCCSGYRYMRPIKAVEPWTFETCPWPLSVVRKSAIEKLTFTIIDKHGAHMGGCVFTYEYLTDHFTQLDGKPCGIVREVDA